MLEEGRIKGKIEVVAQLGLAYDQEILVALPQLFNFEDNEDMKKIESLPGFFQAVIDHLSRFFTRAGQSVTHETLFKKILPTVWPLFIRRADPQKFHEHVRYLKKALSLSSDHLCFLAHYCKKTPEKYPQFCMKHALQEFSFKSKLSYSLLIDVVVGQQCLEPLLSIIKFNVHKQLLLAQQNEYELDTKPCSMTKVIQKMLSLKGNIIRLIHDVDSSLVFARHLDKWSQSSAGHALTIFRLLKTIAICECLLEMKSKDSNEALRPQQPVQKIIFELAGRVLHKLFSPNAKLKILILDWILQGKVWTQNEELKANLMHFLIPCFQIHSQQPLEKGKSPLLLRIEKEENSLITIYLMKVKEKHFQAILFRSKVPKSYLRIKLDLIESQPLQQQESNSCLSKNGTQTISLSKFGIGEQASSKRKGISSQNLGKLIASVIKCTYSLELHKIFILCLVLKEELSGKGNGQVETEPEDQECDQKGNSFRRLYYYICRCVQQYEQVFEFNALTWEVGKIAATFVSYFTFGTVKEMYNADLYDLELLPNSDLCLENIGVNLLKNSIFYSLSTVFVIESAHNGYVNSLNENKRPGGRKDEKLLTIPVNQNCSKDLQLFMESIRQMIKTITKKQQQIEYLNKILQVEDKKVIRSIFLNLVFYMMAKRSRSVPGQRSHKNLQSQLESILVNLYNHYFLKQSPSSQELTVIKILATAHKTLQNWRRSTRRSLTTESKINQSHFYDNHEQEQRISESYWKIVVKSSTKLNVFAQNYERANCIKESIYLLELYNINHFPVSCTTEEIERLFNLYSRLEDHLQTCRFYVFDQIHSKARDSKENKAIVSGNAKSQQENLMKWEAEFKFLSSNPNLESFTSAIFHNSRIICHLEDIEQINHVLNQIHTLSSFYEALRTQNYSKLHQHMVKSNDKAICLSIVQCLQRKKYQGIGPQASKSISSIAYNQKLRFKQYESLLKQLNCIHPENMTPEQVRAAIILYSQTEEYHKVRLLFKAIKAIPEHFAYRQELEFLNIEAGYKCMMFYPVEEILKDLETIVKSIQDEKVNEKVNKVSTSPLFETFKFICQNYPSLSVKEQRHILQLLNRYLKRVNSINNLTLSVEATYFILRYILIESKNPDKLLEDVSIFPFQSYRTAIMEPHRSMLIVNISENEEKNNFICKILLKIAENDPKACSWWLYGLINHCKGLTDGKIDKLDKSIQKVGLQIEKKLRQKMINLDQELTWIDWLQSADEKSQYKAIPKQMVSPFTTEITLQKVTKISPLGHGKSRPVSIQFKGIRNKLPISLSLIRKPNSGNKVGFRTESAAANFFKDSDLLDESVTYSIIHLSKTCILVEYIKHISTLDALMVGKMENNQILKIGKILEISKGTKILGPAFDDEKQRIKFQLFNFFLSEDGPGLINKWWTKYTNFVKTYAQWCFLGYIVGVGDRHTNNILVTAEGKTIHIDFEYIFDSGMTLPYPEWVPFRLSRGLLDQLSIIQPYGLIFSQFIKTAENYRKKSREVWLAQSHFSYFKKSNVSINKRATLGHKPFEQSIKIFENATSPMLLRDMFIGWASYK